jgi:hypothetical protein
MEGFEWIWGGEDVRERSGSGRWCGEEGRMS